MSKRVFSNDCPGCRPSLIDMKTRKVLAADDPIMRKVNAVWETTSVAERATFHRVTCLNARDPVDMIIFQNIARKIQNAL